MEWREGSMKLGHCPKCMRTSFLAAAAAVTACCMNRALELPPPLVMAGTAIAAGLVSLWLAHLLAFAGRAAQGAVARAVLPPATPGMEVQSWPRRRLLFLFAKAFVFAGIASMLPRSAAAQTCSCDQADCTCPAEAPNCFINPSRGESFCCAYGDTGCSSSLLSWCCPNGTNCYGDNGQCY
jgi:hypothetical protein